MSNTSPRRRFLQFAGTGAAASIAGCADAIPNLDSNGNTDDALVTAAVEPDQEALSSFEQELVQDVEDGELSETEAQQEMQARQIELTEDAADEFASAAADIDGLTIEGSMTDLGYFHVDAPPETLIEALHDGTLDVLAAGDVFTALEEQRAEQPGGAVPPGGGPGEPDDGEGSGEGDEGEGDEGEGDEGEGDESEGEESEGEESEDGDG